MASRAGVSQALVSLIETGGGGGSSLRTWMRLAVAVDSELRAYLEEIPGAARPRDNVHLKNQELVARLTTAAGWEVKPEAALATRVDRSPAADLLLERRRESALIEIWDWFDDVGAAFRSWDRKLDQVDRLRAARGMEEGVSGCWVVRATRRNRSLVRDHRTLFRARFPASSAAWLAALTSPEGLVPGAAGLLWVAVQGDRLFPARLA